MKASVIDLGYNSLKMVSYQVAPDGSFRAYDQRGALTRLGEGLHETGFLSEEAMERTLRELALLKEVNGLSGIDRVLPIATSPVREAGNGDRFQREAESVLGAKFRVLSGKEEALFSYIGAARATRFPDVLFFDLGGGSLEFCYAREFRVRRILSLPVGALRMSELYGEEDRRFSKKDYGRMRRRIAELLPTRGELGLSGSTVLLGVGGTVRALAKYDQWLRDYPINKIHNYRLRRKSVAEMNKRLRKMGVRKIADVEALGRDRAQSITAGSLIVSTVMSRLGFEEVVVSTHGLRDGVLTEYLRDPEGYPHERLDEAQANRALEGRRRRAPGAFAAALAAHGVVSPREREILDEAVGSFLGLYLETRSENLFYTILNEDSQLDHGDQVALAISLVRAKAPKTSNWFYARYGSMLNHEQADGGSIDRLAALVQVAEVLELTRSTARVRVRGAAVTFDVTTSRGDFPLVLLEQAARELGDATGWTVKAAVHRAGEGVRAVPLVGGQIAR